MRIPDGELSSRVVRQLLNLGGQEGVDHKHQRFRVPTYREKTKTNVFSVIVFISVAEPKIFLSAPAPWSRKSEFRLRLQTVL